MWHTRARKTESKLKTVKISKKTFLFTSSILPLFQEAYFPRAMRGKTSIEDESISVLPNKPSPYEEGFHEKTL
jgi:hypothetical protein